MSKQIPTGLRGRIAEVLDSACRGGNWADYTSSHYQAGGFVYCGWMDLHDDKDNGLLKGDLVWGFRAYYWNRNAVFIHTLPKSEGSGLVAVRRTADPVFFRADLKHGLVPASELDGVLKSRSTRGVRIAWGASVPPKLVWRWVDQATGNEYVMHKGVWTREAEVKSKS